MKTILCYGDSLTWGYDAGSAGRHAFADRWPSRLAEGLGAGHVIVAEGLNGRTTAFDDNTSASERNGARTLPMLLGSHQPIDLVVILLGTNDLKRHTGGGRAFESRIGMERLVEIVQTFPYHRGMSVPKILIVAPPSFVATDDPDFTLLFSHAIEESQRLPAALALVAEEYGCDVFDASEVCETTPLDGVHLDAENTRRLGDALVEPVGAILARD
ncbi:arylesterase [Aureimonas sp. Leaf454]|uniref:SGNH/GDSL hydrolase family protein n=1 Tax=Aureimonas sp. Leaf454 TaxID=1736381 RepID=UPI0006F1D21D|nr:SGNH/GDSL hydrolase family protein [Aureimonas sp. Leaf454]KQT48702.1 arylesterase [Aureimonas sp. Leaf454]